MEVQPIVHFPDSPSDDALVAEVQRLAARLERYCDHIVSCRVVVERPNKHPDHGSGYRVRAEVTVPPRHELVAERDSGQGHIHQDAGLVLRETFRALEEQVRKLDDQENRRTKRHPQQEVHGIVEELGGDHGFLRTPDDRRIYFHSHSVLGDDFPRLHIGSGVAFAEEMGEKGPQASTVRLVTEQSPPLPLHAEVKRTKP